MGAAHPVNTLGDIDGFLLQRHFIHVHASSFLPAWRGPSSFSIASPDNAYNKCSMTIYTGLNAADRTTLTLNCVEYDAVTGTMGRGDHTPSMFVYSSNNYSCVAISDSEANSYKINNTPVDYKGIELQP